MNKKIWLVGLLVAFATWQSWAQTCSSNHGTCSVTQQENDAVIWLTGLDLTPAAAAAYAPAAVSPDPADETLRCRYSVSATLFSSLSPQIALLSSDDLNSLPHRVAIYGAPHKCAARIVFSGKVFRIYLNVTTDGSVLTNYSPAAPSPNGFKAWYKHWLQDTTEAPGATDIQVGWSPSFNAPQKVNIVATFQPMKSLKTDNYQSGPQTLAEKQWYGIFAGVDKEDRAQQDPDSIVTTFDYIFRADPGNLTPNLGLSFRPPWFEARTGTELSPKSDVLNQINAVYSRWPLVFSSTEQRSFLTLTPVAGVEAGSNFQNHTTVPTHDAIFRWVAGTDASLRFPPVPKWLFGSKPYTLSGIIRARFPRIAEEFTQNQNPHLPETADRRLRIYSKAQLNIPLSRLLSGNVTYQYGDLPPAFRFFGHTISITLKATSPGDFER